VNGTLVIDTNIALDVLVFEDPATQALRQALEQRQCRWLITQSMLDEARRVLDYPLIARRMATRELRVDGVMARWHELSTLLEPAPKAAYTCKDADDQKFIDLAVQHSCVLLSKDAAVLCMARRLQRVGAQVARQWPVIA
jgi:putative PIN family toxin of toxin-antitoxin system